MTEHLHLIREKPPRIEGKPYIIQASWCPECKQAVYIIHLNLPPENPEEVSTQKQAGKE